MRASLDTLLVGGDGSPQRKDTAQDRKEKVLEGSKTREKGRRCVIVGVA